jgi:ParB-like chromosome segregation protein Spo0J
VVKEADKSKYAVSAGEHRRRALRLLAKEGHIAKNEPIACKIIPADQAVEASLAENVVRTNMHPANEIEAFAPDPSRRERERSTRKLLARVVLRVIVPQAVTQNSRTKLTQRAAVARASRRLIS